MELILVQKRWYHSILQKLVPKDIVSQYQIHVSAAMGTKYGRWFLIPPYSFKADLNDISSSRADAWGSVNEICEGVRVSEPWTVPPPNHIQNMFTNLEKKYTAIETDIEKKMEVKSLLDWHNEQREKYKAYAQTPTCFGDQEVYDKASDKCRSCTFAFHCLEKNEKDMEDIQYSL